MMLGGVHFCGVGLSGAFIHFTVKLTGVRRQYRTVEVLREPHGNRRFADCGRAADDEEFLGQGFCFLLSGLHNF